MNLEIVRVNGSPLDTMTTYRKRDASYRSYNTRFHNYEFYL